MNPLREWWEDALDWLEINEASRRAAAIRAELSRLGRLRAEGRYIQSWLDAEARMACERLGLYPDRG